MVMGTFSQGVALHNSSGTGSGPTGLPHSSHHRSSLKAPSQVRWPVNLNQLAALSLEDDSDLDRSFTDGSVKLLQMLKDSDDESTSPVPAQSKLRRPRSTYSSLQGTQRKLQQSANNSITRSSSLRDVEGARVGSGNTSIPKPQRIRSDYKGTNTASGGIARPIGLRHHQSDMSLMATKRRQANSNNSPEDMEHIFSEANAIAQRLGGSGSRAATDTSSAGGIRGPTFKTGALPAPTARASAGADSLSLTRKSSGIPSPLSSSGAQSTNTLAQARSRLSAPSRAAVSSSTSSHKQRSSHPGIAISKQDLRERETTSLPRFIASPCSAQSAPATTKHVLLQSSLSQPLASRHATTDGQIATAMLLTPPALASLPKASIDVESSSTIRELTEELEHWKAEAQGYRQERVAVETWRKQVSDLERDLETALDSLQSAEARVIETTAVQAATGSKLTAYEKIVEDLKTNLANARTANEKALEETAASQKRELAEMETRNKELEMKLTQAQQEVDQLELQVVPAELQDVHQALFSATQELDEAKRHIEKLGAELCEEKVKVAREQEDSGQLLGKISQLQDTIANHLRDNNALKDAVKEHESCQENAEIASQQHKQEVGDLKNEILSHQQSLTQEKEQRARLEQALQEQQYQLHQLQQQVQMQQTQLLQQQTEIVNLRASLEVEQRQAVLFQQRLQEEQRLNNPHFGRRVSMDGELNGSFLMIENSNSAGPNTGIMNMGAADGTMGSMGASTAPMMMHGGLPSSQTLSTSGSNVMSPMNPTMMPSGLQNIRNFDGASPSILTNNQLNMSATQAAAALPPTAGPLSTSTGGMVVSAALTGIMDTEPRPTMNHRGSAGSISGILSTGSPNNNRSSIHGDPLPSSAGATQSVEELTAQLQSLLKEKERLQADLSKIPISGGGPMTRRKAEMLEEQMDETERAISKIRYNIRMRS
ncbi:hypothetical protein BGZ54_004553 [Gamsiella multidivaricata]|nr:hypothetical protein BGZ54_004553 [Gamsiella multidivaricata]